MTPATTTAQPQNVQYLQVPAGARVVAASETPPLPAFSSPGSGTLYIYDQNTNSVAKITTCPPDRGRDVNVNEMPNVTNSLDPHHKYIIYYLPAESAATLPSPLGQ